MPTAKDLSHLLPDVISIARSAGQLILDIYENKSYESYTKVMKPRSPAPISQRINWWWNA